MTRGKKRKREICTYDLKIEPKMLNDPLLMSSSDGITKMNSHKQKRDFILIHPLPLFLTLALVEEWNGGGSWTLARSAYGMEESRQFQPNLIEEWKEG